MKAITFKQPGGPEVLQLNQCPTPEIHSPTEVLVELKAAGVNPIDTKLRQRGTFYPEQMPAILGCDGAGVVIARGAQVKQFQVGDEVYFCHGGLGGHPGTYAEYATVEAAFVAHKPRSYSFVQAAAVPLVLITAWESLQDRARVRSGQQVLVHAGAGGVGHVAIQLVRLWGARVATTISSTAKAEFVRSLGADLAIDYRAEDFAKATLDWTGGTGVDIALDTVGGATFSQTFAAVRPYGDLVTLLEPAPDTNWKVARTRNLRIGFELMLTPILQGLTTAQRQQAEILRQGAELIDRGQLQVQVSKTFPLGAAADAHHLLAAGSITGKIVLVI